MKANEFCYWLQGYFEICEAQGLAGSTLTVKGLKCIKAHLDLVKKVEPEHANVFVAWLTERMERSESGLSLAEVRRFLGAQFQHVIDPSYGGDQNELHKIHASTTGSAWSNDTLIRC